MKTDAINGSKTHIDSREVIERIEELENERLDLVEAISEAEDLYEEQKNDPDITTEDVEEARLDLDRKKEELKSFNEDYGDELANLVNLAEQGEQISDWSYGMQLIHEDCFEDFVKELATEIGEPPDLDRWPYNHIDWAAAAEELKSDYTEIDFDNQVYYIRN